MKKRMLFIVVITILLLITMLYRSMTSNDPLNTSDFFVYKEKTALYWLELTVRNNSLKGRMHQQIILEEAGKEPFIQEKTETLKGNKIENSYEWEINGTTYTAQILDDQLVVTRAGNETKHYKGTSKEEWLQYKTQLQNELDSLIYHREEKEKERIKNFTTQLRDVYGYLYTAEKQSYHLYIKIDEVLLQGEISATLLKIADNNEEKYELNGITNGQKLELFTIVDGQQVKVTGYFGEDVQSLVLTDWKTGEQLMFYAVTEEEFKKDRDF